MKWGYALAEKEFGDKVFTWQQYKNIAGLKGETEADKAEKAARKDGRVIVKDVIADASFSKS